MRTPCRDGTDTETTIYLSRKILERVDSEVYLASLKSLLKFGGKQPLPPYGWNRSGAPLRKVTLCNDMLELNL